MRSTLAAVTLAVTAVVATITFANSLVALLDTPSRYGQGWDRMIDAQFGPAPVGGVIDRIGASDDVEGVAVGTYGDVSVEGLPVAAFDLEAVVGEVSVTIVEGQAGRSPDEIVLGTQTMQSLDARVGLTVQVDRGEGPQPMRVTGRGVFPHMGQGSFSTTGLGVGAQLAGGSFSTFFDTEEVPPDYELDGRTFHFIAIDVKGSPSALDAELAELEASVVADAGFARSARSSHRRRSSTSAACGWCPRRWRGSWRSSPSPPWRTSSRPQCRRGAASSRSWGHSGSYDASCGRRSPGRLP